VYPPGDQGTARIQRSRRFNALHARTLIGPQTIDGRSNFRQQGTKSLIDPQLVQSPHLGDVLHEIIDRVA
jgi:hypothetical protein